MLPMIRSYLVNEGLKHVIWICWIGVNVLLFYYTFMHYYTGVQFYYLHQMLGYGLCISRASAACINLNSGVLLIPMCKRAITYLRGMNCVVGRQTRRMMDRGRSFHILCGHLLCVLAVIHCGAHGYNAFYFSKYYNPKYSELNVAKYANQNPLIMLVTSVAGITGLLLVCSLVIIAAFASTPARRKKHDRFWATHHMFLLYYGLLFIHALDGIIKYQTNIDEHVPGCFMVVGSRDNNLKPMEPFLMPEPEPHAEPFPMTPMKKKIVKRDTQLDVLFNKPKMQKFLAKKQEISNKTMSTKFHMKKPLPHDHMRHQVVLPEPEPFPHGDNKDQFLARNDTIELILINGSWINVTQCDQPPPKFKSCPKEVWMWLCIPLLLYFFERLSRFFRASRIVTTLVGFKQHRSNVIELKFSQKGFKAKPGQTIWVRCPSISQVELHPFSLTSVPCGNDQTFGIHVKVLGDFTWTSELHEKLKEGCGKLPVEDQDFYDYVDEPTLKEFGVRCNREDSFSSDVCHSFGDVGKDMCNSKTTVPIVLNDSLHATHFQSGCNNARECQVAGNLPRKSSSVSNKSALKQSSTDSVKQGHHQPTLYIEGPTGSPMEDAFKYKVTLCVAGGIGVTPFASVLNALLKDDRLCERMKLQRLYLIWACPSIESFEWFANLINDVHEKFWEKNLPDFLNVHLYLTGSKPVDLESSPSPIKRCRLGLSRPNIKEIIENTAQRHTKSTVGVFCCGPRPLISAVKKRCLHPPLKSKTKFVFHKEAF